MALKAPAGDVSILSELGISLELPDAYHKIWHVSSASPGVQYLVTMHIYASEEARREEKNPVGTRTILLGSIPFVESDTLYSAIYTAIKSLVVGYENAIDC